MKRLFYIYLVAAIACVSFHSCLFQEDDLFDDSAANRVTNANNRYAALLQSATNGWVMEYYIGDDYSSGGISILCKFTDKEVEMASTCSVPGADAGTVHSSLYKLIGEQGPMLTFDSYNPVMHYFATPTGGGSDPNGTLGGDYEFVIRSATDTQIVLEGKKVGNTMVMTRLADDVTWNDYIDNVTTMEENAFLNTYEVKEGGQVVGMLQRTDYTFTMTDALGDVIYDVMPFVYTETGLKFREPFVINGTSVQYLEWDEASRALVSADGTISFEGVYPEGWRNPAASCAAGAAVPGEAVPAGASGVEAGAGSSLDLLRETTYMEDTDTSNLRYNAMRSRGGRIAEAQQSSWNAQATRIGGENAARATTNAGKAALWGSLLGGASLVAGKWDYLTGGSSGKRKKSSGSLSGGTGLFDSGYWG